MRPYGQKQRQVRFGRFPSFRPTGLSGHSAGICSNGSARGHPARRPPQRDPSPSWPGQSAPRWCLPGTAAECLCGPLWPCSRSALWPAGCTSRPCETRGPKKTFLDLFRRFQKGKVKKVFRLQMESRRRRRRRGSTFLPILPLPSLSIICWQASFTVPLDSPE